MIIADRKVVLLICLISEPFLLRNRWPFADWAEYSHLCGMCIHFWGYFRVSAFELFSGCTAFCADKNLKTFFFLTFHQLCRFRVFVAVYFLCNCSYFSLLLQSPFGTPVPSFQITRPLCLCLLSPRLSSRILPSYPCLCSSPLLAIYPVSLSSHRIPFPLFTLSTSSSPPSSSSLPPSPPPPPHPSSHCVYITNVWWLKGVSTQGSPTQGLRDPMK